MRRDGEAPVRPRVVGGPTVELAIFRRPSQHAPSTSQHAWFRARLVYLSVLSGPHLSPHFRGNNTGQHATREVSNVPCSHNLRWGISYPSRIAKADIEVSI